MGDFRAPGLRYYELTDKYVVYLIARLKVIVCYRQNELIGPLLSKLPPSLSEMVVFLCFKTSS